MGNGSLLENVWHRACLAVLAGFLGFGATAHAAAVDWAKARPVTVVASEYEFTPSRIVFRRGTAYRLTVANRGKELHEFNAPQFFKAITMRDAAALNDDHTEIDVQPGQQKVLYFVARHDGRFRLICPDHDWAGMTGTIIVH
jgi:uncharacterized cupredoxin-like copper-binding protein